MSLGAVRENYFCHQVQVKSQDELNPERAHSGLTKAVHRKLSICPARLSAPNKAGKLLVLPRTQSLPCLSSLLPSSLLKLPRPPLSVTGMFRTWSSRNLEAQCPPALPTLQKAEKLLVLAVSKTRAFGCSLLLCLSRLLLQLKCQGNEPSRNLEQARTLGAARAECALSRAAKHTRWRQATNVAALHRLDAIFAKMKQMLPALDLLTKKMVDKGDIDDVKLLQERGQGIPAKSGGSFMAMNTSAFTETLLERVKKEFSRLEYEAVNSMTGDLQWEFRACERGKEITERRSDRMFASDSIEWGFTSLVIDT